MRLKFTYRTAITELITHKKRSLLTILGIVIGITSIVLIMSLGRGAQNLIVGQIQGLGSKTIIILPGRQPKNASDAAAFAAVILSDSLKQRDLEALQQKSNAPHLEKIMPIVYGADVASYENQTFQLTILGASEQLPYLQTNLVPSEGDFFTADDVKNAADAVVIGQKVKKELFENSEAVGEKIRIKGKNFRVVGVLPEKGPTSLINFDEIAIIPYTTAQQYLFGIKYYNRFWVEADSELNVAQTAADITAVLREMHNITDPAKDDFSVQTQEGLMESIGTVTSILTWFLVAMAAISLLVGGVGIMNIMLVSVTERTREIGLRKALGATTNNILTQFLLEAVALTLSGGLIGIMLGLGFSFVITQVLSKFLALDWKFVFPVSGMVLGFGVAVSLGLIFGLYPARQASLKDPIEALRQS